MKKGSFSLGYRMILLLILLSLLLGCNSKGARSAQQLPDVHSGTMGLEMGFLKNTPPKLVFEQSSFPIILRIRNLGASAIPNPENPFIGDKQAILSLGLETDYIQALSVEEGGRVVSTNPSDPLSNEAQFSIEGKSLINLKGDEEVISYTVTPARIDPQSETHQSLAIATLCYPYQTELVSTVCIDPDPSNIRLLKKSCKAEDLSFPSGQGAPVAIAKVEVQMLPNQQGTIRPQFLVTVENRGKGDVTKIGSYDSICRGRSGTATIRDLNGVKMEAYLSGQALECYLRDEGLKIDGGQKDEYVRLVGKSDVVRCTYPTKAPQQILQSTETYTAPLRILLTYGYTQSESIEYTIKKISVN